MRRHLHTVYDKRGVTALGAAARILAGLREKLLIYVGTTEEQQP